MFEFSDTEIKLQSNQTQSENSGRILIERNYISTLFISSVDVWLEQYLWVFNSKTISMEHDNNLRFVSQNILVKK